MLVPRSAKANFHGSRVGRIRSKARGSDIWREPNTTSYEYGIDLLDPRCKSNPVLRSMTPEELVERDASPKWPPWASNIPSYELVPTTSAVRWMCK
ncbi:MAG: hypothetical protein ACXABY_06830 [Candidatus Thorarchaeota archaeon]|jgi:hypothetical protein